MRVSVGLPVPEGSEIPAGLWGVFLCSQPRRRQTANPRRWSHTRRQRCKRRASQAIPQIPSHQTRSRGGKVLRLRRTLSLPQRDAESPARGRAPGRQSIDIRAVPKGRNSVRQAPPTRRGFGFAPVQRGRVGGGIVRGVAPGWWIDCAVGAWVGPCDPLNCRGCFEPRIQSSRGNARFPALSRPMDAQESRCAFRMSQKPEMRRNQRRPRASSKNRPVPVPGLKPQPRGHGSCLSERAHVGTARPNDGVRLSRAVIGL